MTIWGDYRSCERSREVVGADVPPRLLPYPEASKPVRLLFVGWNPPRPNGGFWSRDDDRLLATLHQIFRELKWSATAAPPSFREEFRQQGFYFMHVVKCFSGSRFPAGSVGTSLLRTCALAHLKEDIEHLRPERICVLGQLPFRAFKICYGPRLPRLFGRGEVTIPVGETEVPTLITYFPNQRRQGGTQQWEIARDDLEAWARNLPGGVDEASTTVRGARLSFDSTCRLVTLGEAVAQIPAVNFAYLFGSAARRNLRPLSDVDLAVYLTHGTEIADARLAVTNAVTRHLRTDAVDVVILNSAPTALVGRILRDRQVILDRDPFNRHKFESAELRKFFDFAVRERRLLAAMYPSGRREPDPAEAR